MENTTHYGLKKWDPEDRVLRTEFNDNSDKTDAAIADAQAAADGAAQTARTALSTAQTTQTTAAEQGSAIAALQAALAARGNCSIEYGTYTGDGRTDPISRTFSGTPYLVLITDVENGGIVLATQGMERSRPMPDPTGYDAVILAWSGKTITWSDTHLVPGVMMNEQGRRYTYVAFTRP